MRQFWGFASDLCVGDRERKTAGHVRFDAPVRCPQ
jgi:hypothetical protein